MFNGFPGKPLSRHTRTTFLFRTFGALSVLPDPTNRRGSPQAVRSNFGPIQEGDCATFSAVSDTRCSTYLIFTAFLTAERSTIELPGSAQAALGGSLTKAPNSVKEARENEKKMAGVHAGEITNLVRFDGRSIAPE
jgi:hypothetical protein